MGANVRKVCGMFFCICTGLAAQTGVTGGIGWGFAISLILLIFLMLFQENPTKVKVFGAWIVNAGAAALLSYPVSLLPRAFSIFFVAGAVFFLVLALKKENAKMIFGENPNNL